MPTGGTARVVSAGPAGGSRFILEVPTTNPDPDHDGSWPDQEDYDSVTTIFERVNAGAGRS